jgi:hypothetical protein
MVPFRVLCSTISDGSVVTANEVSLKGSKPYGCVIATGSVTEHGSSANRNVGTTIVVV